MRSLGICGGAAIVLTTFLSDQLSKWYIESILSFRETLEIFPGLNFMLTYNHGAAFGFLSQSSGWQRWFFVGTALLVSVILAVWYLKVPKSRIWERVALACVLGGALGNLADRIAYGHVVDFIDVYYHRWHWYTFNVADILICLGAAVLIFYELFRNKQASY